MKIFLSVLMIILFVFVHALIGLYVDKLKFIKGESRTNWELIPFTNVYLLGKHAFNKVVGAILFVLLFFVVNWTITLFGQKYGFTLYSDSLRHILFIIYLVIIILVLIYSIYKYNRLTDGKDKFKFSDLLYYLKETLWILVFIIAIYLFVLFVRSASI